MRVPMHPGRVVAASRACRRARWTDLVAVAVVVAVGLGGPAANAQVPGFGIGQQGPTSPTSLAPLPGIGGATNVTGLTATDLVTSPFSLADIDPVTGHLVGDHVGGHATSDAAMAVDLLADGQLAIDAAEIARKAQAEIERRRRARRPGQGVAIDRASNPGSPSPEELDTFPGDCHPANVAWQARIETVAAFQAMCTAAKADGISIQLNSAYRSPQRQVQLFRAAVARYGSEAAARKWVAWSDGTSCSSRHCSGQALDIASAGGAHQWLHTPVGCWSAAGGVRMGGSCGAGERTVVRANLYGFVAPMSHEPWHFELGIPIAGGVDEGGNPGYASCNPDPGQQVQALVAQIFRCKLRAAGYPEDRVAHITAEALMIAKCESGFRADARAGVSSAAGVFQFLTGSSHWIPGGRANVFDPVANITGAADYFIASDDRSIQPITRGSVGWRPWACSPRLSDVHGNANVFRNGMPDWAYQW